MIKWCYPKRLPLGMFLCLMLLIVSEAGVRAVEKNFWTHTHGVIDHKRRVLTSSDRKNYNALVLGDSQILRLDAKHVSEQLTKNLGRTFNVYNFAIQNHGVETYPLLLQKYLDYHHPPEYIFLSIPPLALTGEWSSKNTGEVSRSLYFMSDLYSIPEVFGMLPWRDYLRFSLVEIESLSSLVRYRLQLRESIRHNQWDLHVRIEEQEKSLSKYNGGTLIQRPSRMSIDEVRQLDYYDASIELDPYTLEIYHKVCRIAEKYDVKVLVTNVPILDEIVANREKSLSNQRYKQFIYSLVNRYEHVSYVEPIIRPYDYKYFEDWHHLTADGVEKFTHALVDDLSAFLNQDKSFIQN